MRTTETHLWKVPATPHRRGYVSAVHLTREEAMERYGPGATPVEGSMKLRQELEGDELRSVMQSAGRDGARS